jgi:hypothetical protein
LPGAEGLATRAKRAKAKEPPKKRAVTAV